MGPHHWGYGQRREGDPRMAQQENPKDWIVTVADLIRYAGEVGTRPSELLRSTDLGALHKLMR